MVVKECWVDEKREVVLLHLVEWTSSMMIQHLIHSMFEERKDTIL